ncbi:MAG: alpha/beta hydrolase [Candidatus Thorarchaeota archaeon]
MNKGLIFGIVVLFGFILSFIGIGFQAAYLVDIGKYEEIYSIDSFGNSFYSRYYPAKNSSSEKGIMIFHGLAEDQHTMRSFTNIFLNEGFHVYVMDFSGHGNSRGVFTLNQSMDDIVSDEVLLAKQKFKELSLLKDSQIYQLGHSLGARAILKAATMDSNIVRGLILIGAFIGEDGLYPYNSWINTLSPINPATNISIITSNFEDILPVSDAIKLFENLSGKKYNETSGSTYTSEDNLIEMTVLRNLFHTYEPIAPKALITAVLSIYHFEGQIFPKDKPEIIRQIQVQNIISWLLIPIGLILAVIFGIYFLDETRYRNPFQVEVEECENELIKINSNHSIEITNFKFFVYYKLVIWLGGIGFGALIGLLFIFLPFGFPVFTLVYVCPITGYGVMMLILYATEKMPGLKGKWKPNLAELKVMLNWKRPIFALLTAILSTAILGFSINANWNTIVAWNAKAAWLVVLSIFTTFGFYIKRKESNLIRKLYPGDNNKLILNNFLYLVPFFILAIILVIMGINFLFIDSLHGFFFFLFVVLIGGIIQRFCKNEFFTALLQSIILIILVLPRTPILAIV